ncbi:MAG: hypothetical protein HYR92_05230 [Burkholderiales bacterium]|nr:hypothetical protein [Burkholderiales bacterium]
MPTSVAPCTTLPHQAIILSVCQSDEVVYIDRAFSERSGMQVVRADGPDIHRQAVPLAG